METYIKYKYIRIVFSEISEKIKYERTNSLNSYTKNKLYHSIFWHMDVDSDKLEVGKEKFKKGLLKYYSNLISKIEEQIWQLPHLKEVGFLENA